MIRKLKEILCILVLRFFSIFPLQKKIIFSSFDGKNYGDNPKALYLRLLSEYGEAYRYVWLMYDTSVKIEGSEVVKAYSLRALYHIATSKLWIHNSRQRIWIRKRRGQFYVQTWHGNIALKKIEKDAEATLPEIYIRQAKHDSKLADLFLAGSEWNAQNYRSSFWYSGEILKVGLPRSDIFFEDSTSICKKINQIYDIKENDRVILYCPTFRTDGRVDAYFTDYTYLIESLQASTLDNWKMIVRLHPNVQETQKDLLKSPYILDGSQIPDLNELIVRSEFVITDYSSSMFDALMIGKKVYLYVSDLDIYKNERGQYFEVSSLPFSLSIDSSQLVSAILSDEAEKYKKEAEKFLRSCGLYERGNASQMTVKRLESILK